MDAETRAINATKARMDDNLLGLSEQKAKETLKNGRTSETFKDIIEAIRFTDDHDPSNKIIGIKSLDAILRNVNGSELSPKGWDNLILHTLRNLLYQDDENLINVLLPTISFAIQMFQKNESYNDNVVVQILKNIEMSLSTSLKLIYMQHLATFMNILELSTLKHYRRISSVIAGCLQQPASCSNFELFKVALVNLQQLMKLCWPRVHHHFGEILMTIIRFTLSLQDNLQFKNEMKEMLIIEINECCNIMKSINTAEFEKYQTCIEDNNNPAFELFNSSLRLIN